MSDVIFSTCYKMLNHTWRAAHERSKAEIGFDCWSMSGNKLIKYHSSLQFFNHFPFISFSKTHQNKPGWCVGLHAAGLSFHHVGISTKSETSARKRQQCISKNNTREPTWLHFRCNDSISFLLKQHDGVNETLNQLQVQYWRYRCRT